MTLEDIKEVRTVRTDKEANELLQEGWVLLNATSEKCRVKTGTTEVGIDFVSSGFFANGSRTPRYEVVYKDRLECLYQLGRK